MHRTAALLVSCHSYHKVNRISTNRIIPALVCILALAGSRCHAQKYQEVAFYICAHQDDWQLFMGADAYNDINQHDEKLPQPNGKKVVIIYTTAGNLNDDDDTRTCQCRTPGTKRKKPVPYWAVREAGAKNSVWLAASRMGGYGPSGLSRANQKVTINGRDIQRHQYKNTSSYFLRCKAGIAGHWYQNEQGTVGTVDNSTTYHGLEELVQTIYGICLAELDTQYTTGLATFHFPDTNDSLNPNDHHDHYLAGQVAARAAQALAAQRQTCYTQYHYIDYHTQNLPENLPTKDMQSEAAIVATYCQALLDYNAWQEWGLYYAWTARNYYRTDTACPQKKQ